MEQEQLQLPRSAEVPIKNGIFTIVSGKTGEHRTFRINTVLRGNLKGKRILGLLTGPDNTSSYKGFAFVDDDRITVWRKYRGEGDWEVYAHLVYCLSRQGQMSPDGRIRVEGLSMSLLFQGRCCRCNRALTVPSSIESGIGPICAGKD